MGDTKKGEPTIVHNSDEKESEKNEEELNNRRIIFKEILKTFGEQAFGK